MTADPLARYQSMPDAELQRVLLLEYRCAKGCLLLHVFNTPAGPCYYRPPVRVSDRMQRRTGMDEGNRIAEAAGALADFSPDPWVWGDTPNSLHIGCRHITGVHFPAAHIIADAASATPGNPLRNSTFWMAPDAPR